MGFHHPTEARGLVVSHWLASGVKVTGCTPEVRLSDPVDVPLSVGALNGSDAIPAPG